MTGSKAMSKQLRAPTAKPVVLGAIQPNAGVEAAYRKKLQDLVTEMSRSYIYWTRAAWKKDDPGLAMDAGPVAELRKTMRRLGEHWQSKFAKVAPELAGAFANGATSTAQAAFQAELAKAGFAVKFTLTDGAKEAYQSVLQSNVSLIKSIPSEYHTAVEGDVWRAVQSGYDLEKLTHNLHERYGVTHRRAAFIAKDQTAKAKAAIEQARRVELGLYFAIWQHSHAGQEPRIDHVKAGQDKLRFDVRKGAYIGGKWILPGTEPRCRCTSRTIIPGFDE